MSPLTFGPDVQLCSETKWTSGNVGGDPQRDVPQGRLERFLGFFVKHIVSSAFEQEAETRGVYKGAKSQFSLSASSYCKR